eukprot:m.161242 g.161242  ORF g.161242 m.161242 type:complete len:132 (+) comp14571_c0_seq2:120-515(+)
MEEKLAWAVGGAGVATVVCWFAYTRSKGPAVVEAGPSVLGRRAAKAAQREDPGLITEQLSRNTLFLGESGQDGLRGAFVVVVGLGGVGSHAAHMLARSGVGRLRLVDFDNVKTVPFHRHSTRNSSTCGTRN